MTTFAKTLSYLFHPIFIPIYGLLMMFNMGLYINYVLSPGAINIIMAIVIVNTIIFPLALIAFLRYKRVIPDFFVSLPKQRLMPYLMTFTFYFITYYIFSGFGIPVVISAFMLGAAISILILLLLNFKWKISAHMVGMGGLFGMVYCASDFFLSAPNVYILPSIFLAGLVGFSRLKLNAHKPSEIYVGFLVGFLSEYITVYFELYG